MDAKIKLAFAFLLILCISCNQKSDNTNKEQRVSGTWGTIEIPTLGNILSIADNPFLLNIKGVEYYTNYNHELNCLKFYNLNQQIFHSKISFFSSGPNMINGLGNYFIWNNLIVHKSASIIQLINFEGEITKTLKMNDLDANLGTSYSFTDGAGIQIGNLMSLSLDKESQSTVIPLFNKENGYSNKFKSPIFLEYNLSSKQVTPHKVAYPDDIDKMFYGPLSIPNILSKGDSIIYNFPYMASVFIFNKATKKITSKPFSVQNIPAKIEGLRLSEKGDIMALASKIRGDVYHNIDFDPHKMLYYMVYSEKLNEQKLQKRHLVVFNNLLEKIGEIELPSGLSPRYAISKKGLLFRNVKDDSFYTLTLHVLNVEVEKK